MHTFVHVMYMYLQLIHGPMMDPKIVRQAIANGDDGAGVMDKMNETLSNHFRLLKQKLKIPDDASEEGGGGSENGSGLVKDQMRRALQFMSLGKGGGSDGGSENGAGRGGGVGGGVGVGLNYSSDGNSNRGGGGMHSSREGRGGGGVNGKSSSVKEKQRGGGAGAGMDAATLNKLKKRQAKELVILRGILCV